MVVYISVLFSLKDSTHTALTSNIQLFTS